MAHEAVRRRQKSIPKGGKVEHSVVQPVERDGLLQNELFHIAGGLLAVIAGNKKE